MACGMADMLEAATETATPSKASRIPKQLAPYVFKPGHAPIKGGGRPKGSRNAESIYLESLPIKARQWVKSKAPAVLIDARKIALQIDSDTSIPASVSSRTIVFMSPLVRPVDADAVLSEPPLPLSDAAPSADAPHA